MTLECIICYERCRKPISCQQCRKILCSEHLKDIRMRCPNCRTEPFIYIRQYTLDKLIEAEVLREREQEKRTKVYKCLSEACEFEGKYHTMVKHHRRMHRTQKLEEILYFEQRQKKYRRIAFQQIIRRQLQAITPRHNQIAFFIYNRNFGQCNLYTLIKMVEHLDKCQNPSCRKIYVEGDRTYIGNMDKIATQCHRGKVLAALI